MTGPLALVGSGEFTPAMEAVDAALLEGRPPRVVHLPTAAALEGEERLAYWVDLARAHYRSLGVESTALMVLGRDDADSADLAATIAGAGLIYLSGGNPAYLARTLVGTAVAAAIREAWLRGAAVAGCSAGAIALTEHVPDIRHRRSPSIPGLGLLSRTTVIPHFDQIEQWMPGAIAWAVAATPPGVHLLGIDEETALVGGPPEWRVMGSRQVWELAAGGQPVGHGDGETLVLG